MKGKHINFKEATVKPKADLTETVGARSHKITWRCGKKRPLKYEGKTNTFLGHMKTEFMTRRPAL